jgi:hypothetical protein
MSNLTHHAVSNPALPIIYTGSYDYPEDFVAIKISKNFFLSRAEHSMEYLFDFNITKEMLVDLKSAGVDLISFVQRDFLGIRQKYSFTSETTTSHF